MFNSIIHSCLSLLFLFPSGIAMPVNKQLILLETAQLTLTLESQEILDLFKRAEYVESEDNLVLETVGNIHSILIYNSEGDLEFMLPVGSSQVQLGRSMFNTGAYQLGFNFQKHEDITYANVFFK